MNVCILLLYVISSNILVVTRSSPGTWQCQENFCYSLFTEYGGVTFRAANEKCQESDSHLVSIHSEKESQLVENIRTEVVGMPVWLGMERFLNQQTWIDGTPVDFLPSEWDYHSAQNPYTCIYSSGDWYEGKCDNNLYFICKRKVKMVTEISDVWSATDIVALSKSDNTIQSSHTSWNYGKTELTDMTSTLGTSVDPFTSSQGSSYLDQQYVTREFEEKLKGLRVKKRKISTKEAPGGQAIGAVAILILSLMFAGVILLDLNTFQQNWRMFRINVSQMRD